METINTAVSRTSVASGSSVPWLRTSSHSQNHQQKRNNRAVGEFLAAIDRLPEFKRGRLQTIKPLGSGTFFQTEACRDAETGTVFAVKRLHRHSTWFDSETSLDDSILQELKISAYPPLQSHPNICRTVGMERTFAFDDNIVLSLVVEFAQQGSLADFLLSSDSSTSDINWSQRRSFAIDISSGLEILHKCRIVHGDLTLDNVLIFRNTSAPDGPPYTAKLSDFGSAIVEDTALEDIDDALMPLYRGTFIYLPQYVRVSLGRLPLHLMPYCDFYSLGLVLWSVYAGRPFYELSLDRDALGGQKQIEEMSVQEVREAFAKYFASVDLALPVHEYQVLEAALNLCVTDLPTVTRSPPPVERDQLYRTSFSKVSDVKAVLMTDRDESNRYTPCPYFTPFFLNSRSREPEIYEYETAQPFHIGILAISVSVLATPFPPLQPIADEPLKLSVQYGDSLAHAMPIPARSLEHEARYQRVVGPKKRRCVEFELLRCCWVWLRKKH
jgi:serine/threonine protein kinase